MLTSKNSIHNLTPQNTRLQNGHKLQLTIHVN